MGLLPPTVSKQNFLCRTRTNAKGEYVFDDVPIGLYIVVCILALISFRWETHSFDFSSRCIPLRRCKSSLFLIKRRWQWHTKTFKWKLPSKRELFHSMGEWSNPARRYVSSFSSPRASWLSSSSVQDPVVALSNVQISVDGKACCQTDSNGVFQLTRVRPTGTIKVKGELDGYIFKELLHPIHLNRLIGIGESSTSLILTPEKYASVTWRWATNERCLESVSRVVCNVHRHGNKRFAILTKTRRASRDWKSNQTRNTPSTSHRVFTSSRYDAHHPSHSLSDRSWPISF